MICSKDWGSSQPRKAIIAKARKALPRTTLFFERSEPIVSRDFRYAENREGVFSWPKVTQRRPSSWQERTASFVSFDLRPFVMQLCSVIKRLSKTSGRNFVWRIFNTFFSAFSRVEVRFSCMSSSKSLIISSRDASFALERISLKSETTEAVSLSPPREGLSISGGGGALVLFRFFRRGILPR
mmetsp:Transcript_19280/g.27138  ORF Transcript_19280/g.27138 Transcript_19280/m.27138 type:complete len:183 (-) Transcript_19280:166-714(-)